MITFAKDKQDSLIASKIQQSTMIQRIQTIYLLLTALAMGSLFLFPFAAATPTPDGVFTDGLLNTGDDISLLIGAIGTTALPFINIFLFNNRSLQMNLNKLLLMLILVVIGASAYFLFRSAASFSVGVSLFTPIVSLILVLMANRSIKSDENLVRSMDRIR